jgi:hypothetical protein
MSEEVWVVVSSYYDDYEIVGLCSTEEIGKKLSRLVEHGKPPFKMRVDALKEIAEAGKKLWMVWVRDGEFDVDWCPLSYMNLPSCVSDQNNLRLMIWAEDYDKALEIAKEKHARWVSGLDTYPDYTRTF